LCFCITEGGTWVASLGSLPASELPLLVEGLVAAVGLAAVEVAVDTGVGLVEGIGFVGAGSVGSRASGMRAADGVASRAIAASGVRGTMRGAVRGARGRVHAGVNSVGNVAVVDWSAVRARGGRVTRGAEATATSGRSATRVHTAVTAVVVIRVDPGVGSVSQTAVVRAVSTLRGTASARQTGSVTSGRVPSSTVSGAGVGVDSRVDSVRNVAVVNGAAVSGRVTRRASHGLVGSGRAVGVTTGVTAAVQVGINARIRGVGNTAVVRSVGTLGDTAAAGESSSGASGAMGSTVGSTVAGAVGGRVGVYAGVNSVGNVAVVNRSAVRGRVTRRAKGSVVVRTSGATGSETASSSGGVSSGGVSSGGVSTGAGVALSTGAGVALRVHAGVLAVVTVGVDARVGSVHEVGLVRTIRGGGRAVRAMGVVVAAGESAIVGTSCACAGMCARSGRAVRGCAVAGGGGCVGLVGMERVLNLVDETRHDGWLI